MKRSDHMRQHQYRTRLWSLLAAIVVTTVGLVATPSFATAQTAANDKAETLKDDALAISGRYARFERLLSQMADLMAIEDPERAELLRRAISQSREQAIRINIDAIAGLLADDSLGDAIDRQQTSADAIRELLKLLQSEDRRSAVERERERLNAVLKDVKNLEAQQRAARATAQNSTGPSNAAPQQQKAANDADKILEGIKEHDKSQVNESEEAGDGKQSDSKDGEPKDSKSKNGEPGDSSKGDEKSSDSEQSGEKSEGGMPEDKGDGDNKDPKDGEKSDGEKQDGEKQDGDEPKEAGDKSDSENSDGKKSDGKSSEKSENESSPNGQPQESERSKKSQQGRQSQQQQQPSQDQNKQDNDEQQAESTPGRVQIEQARQMMQEALEELKKQNREGAVDKQDDAIAKLQDAVKKLEELLRQLREEEKEMILAALEARFQRLLILQTQIHETTVDLAATPRKEWLDTAVSQCRELAQQQVDLTQDCSQVTGLLREDGTSVSIIVAVEDIETDMGSIANRLQETKVGSLTQSMQTDVLEALKELIEATQREMEDMKSEDRKQQQQQQQTSQEKPPLVELMAEIRVLRSLQLRVNRRTKQIHELSLENDTTEAEDLQEQLAELARRQDRLRESAGELSEQMEQKR
ncbi:hypothetical protein [Fuerstiella marisgermanici]|uniref:DUF5667 domain-containing protein n=1 Tax=Fuerstiella marisgermanici TaxID=1891926 RepID=A0A1P8WRU0_9PLAN|nr:hypothetical protein [Fuerstiella marisgermanici]APZ96773.1 hypothetical protein Fuma_06447 [Fuerstiella marisgermanici]